MTSTEVTDWLAFFQLDPWGGERGDMRAGIVASVVANVNRGNTRAPFEASDFMPKFGPAKPVTKADQMAVLDAIKAVADINDAK